ncbi:oligosaccharide flippase family protein [Bradyrhizobium sp. 4]|uniref:oligosaccharide flippase family protein n=1 Tax=unclassified Bradyrhizobium TaxID=2631580 RepID=UPI001FFB6F95|nr:MULTISPECIES: oligosaccharide flippase family protein [unclassified Bradyrhizobium]MCK1397432.1 oligosaccharide flippase family protein [Bradyrhizobium sp. 39]MCK1752529.1 oligosaccharide flippase family protein [Bradyrhizobium sp. 135]UPJ36748.1 oligosaccharide flippase family protein [Bradyrhizobium sp. 4]
MATPTELELSASEARHRAARGAMSVLGRHALVRLLAFVGTLALARLIAPAEFGLFAASQFVLTVLQAIAVGGITAALIRRREMLLAADYRVALTLQQTATAIIIITILTSAPKIATHWEDSAGLTPIIQAMALALFPISLRSIPFAMLQRALRHDRTTICEIIEYIVYLVIAIGGAAYGLGVWALVAATLLRHTTGATVAYLLVHSRPRFDFELPRALELMRFALPLQGQMLIDLAQRSVIPVVIGLFFGAAAVGIASMANTMLEALLLQPLVMLAGVQFRLFSRIQDDPQAVGALLERSIAAGAMVFLPPVLFLGIIAPVLMPHVLSSQWANVGELIRSLTAVSAIQVLAVPTAQAAKALGQTRALLVGGLAGFAIQVALVSLLAQPLGLTSYPIAATIGVAANFAFVFLAVGRRVGMRPIRSVFPIIGGLALTGAIWWTAIATMTSFPLIGAACLAGGLVYLIVVVAFSGRHLAALLRFASSTAPFRAQGQIRALATWVEGKCLMSGAQP